MTPLAPAITIHRADAGAGAGREHAGRAARPAPALARTARGALRAFAADPRHYQIAALAGLLVWGLTALRFEIGPLQCALTLAAALATQWAFARRAGIAFEPRSALISGLSLCLLLRANQPLWGAVAAGVAVASKFVFRLRGKHILNPTNGAIVILLALGAPVWVSPAQWGNIVLFAFAMACIGGLVVHRALRSDVTLAFMAFYAAILMGRALLIGQRLAIPVHQLESGAFLLFSFFLISDPKTTPDSRAGRLLFAALVAAGAAFIQFGLWRTNGLLWSLAAFSFAVPLIDRALPGAHYQWNRAAARPGHTQRGEIHETLPDTSIAPGPAPAY